MACLAQTYSRTAAPKLVSACTFGSSSIVVYAVRWSAAQHRPLCSTTAHCCDSNSARPNSTTACHASPDAAAPHPYVDQSVPEDDWLQRSRLLVGADGLAKLSAVNVLLVGLGGVGSFAAEFLCRAGVGSMTIVDGDTVDTTNRNRQLPALKSTVGQLKTEVVAGRLRDINPEVKLTIKQEFLDPVRAAALVQEQQYQYVIDCIDSVAPKQALLLAGHAAGCKVVSSMGAGGRLDPSRVRLADISQTYNDGFAAVVRRGLRKAGVNSGVTVVFSDELAMPASLALTQQQYKKSYFGTSSYIPALFGLYIASHVIRDVVQDGYKLPAVSASPDSKRSSGGSGSSSRGKSRKRKQQQSEQQQPQQAAGGINSPEVQLQPHQPHAPVQNRAIHVVAAHDAHANGDGVLASTRKDAAALGAEQTSPQQQRGLADAKHIQDVSSTLYSFERSQGNGMGYDGEGI